MCAGVSSARSRRTARCNGVGRHRRYTSRTGSGISIHRSGLTCCMMSAIGKRTARKSGVTGSLVPGWSTGAGGTGMSALMLYQALGSRDSSRRNLCWVMLLKIHAGALVRERENPGGAAVLDDGHGVLEVGRQRAILGDHRPLDRKSTRLNSSHGYISYAVFCLKKKKHHSNEQNSYDFKRQ